MIDSPETLTMQLRRNLLEHLGQKLVQEKAINTSGWVERCAIIRWFDEDALKKFALVSNPSGLLSLLGRYSFIETRSYGYALHDLVRESICQEMSYQSPKQLVSLHWEAANYYRQRMLDDPSKNAQYLLIELLYHLVRANEDAGIAEMKGLAITTQIFSQLDLAIALLETTSGVALHRSNRAWIDLWRRDLLQKEKKDQAN